MMLSLRRTDEFRRPVLKWDKMPKRRDILLSVLPALGAMAATSGTPQLPNATFDPVKAKLDRQPFGDLRIYFEGPTDQLKSVTAGSLLLKAGMTKVGSGSMMWQA